MSKKPKTSSKTKNQEMDVDMPTGEMEEPHWHAWRVEVVFSGPELNDDGMLVDFVIVEQALARILGPLEGTDLNAFAGLEGQPPSTELVARYVHDRLQESPWTPARVARVTIEEAPGCRATYAADPFGAAPGDS